LVFIVLIHWRIKPTQADVLKFKNFWRTQVPINDDNNLIGEFLSEPVPADQLLYRVDGMAPEETEAHFSFVNVGIWRDEESFRAQIGRYIPDDPQKKADFEQYPRRRIPLNPMYWRRGKFQLPDTNKL
jgi:hypothetical protein